jgi:hypothetical protein
VSVRVRTAAAFLCSVCTIAFAGWEVALVLLMCVIVAGSPLWLLFLFAVWLGWM